MSFLGHPALMNAGAACVITPDGSHDIPADLWAEYAALVLLEPEPAELAVWINRLEANLGVSDHHRRQIERATVLDFPGAGELTGGHALTRLLDEPDGDGPLQLRREAEIRAADGALDWYLVRAATRREKRAEEALVDAGFAVYLPRRTCWRRTGRTKERVQRALFDGYMFVGLGRRQSIEGIEAIDAVHAVVRFSRATYPTTVSFELITDLVKDEITGEHDNTRRKTEVEPGTPVSIVRGQFKAFPAEFVKLRENERVEVMLQMFGRKTPMLIDRDDLAIAGEDDEA